MTRRPELSSTIHRRRLRCARRRERSWRLLMGEVLCLEGVWKAFDRGRDRVSVLEDVSLSVGVGEVVAVVGTRDQGKTSLIRVASGMLPADRGSVCVGGVELGGLRDRQLAGVLASEVGVAVRTG